MSTEIPQEIALKKQSRCLAVSFENGEQYEYSFEYLRVHSPSAEVKGHGKDDAVLQVGKENVLIDTIEPVGNYAIKIIFNDGHNTGLYTWSYLKELRQNMQDYWQDYLQKLSAAGHTRQQDG